MSELFGAPNGIIASDANIRQNITAGLAAAKTLGEIEQQPVELELKRAQVGNTNALARYHGAEADKALAAIEKGKRWDAFQRQAVEEDQAKARADAGKRAQGLGGLTVGDMRPGGFSAPAATVGTRLMSMAETLQRLGAPPEEVAKFAKEGSLVVQHEAAAEHSKSQVAGEQLKQRGDRSKQLATIANYALQGETQFRTALASAAGDPILAPYLTRIPQNFNDARPLLAKLVAEGNTMHEKAMEAAADLTARSRASEAAAANKRADASVMVAGAKFKVLNELYERRVANDGHNTPEAREAAKELTESRRSLREARDAKAFTKIPLSSADVIIGTNYTLANGQKAKAVSDPNGTVKDAKGRPFSLVPITVDNKMSEDDLAILRALGED